MPLFDQATVAEFRLINEENLPHRATVLVLTETRQPGGVTNSRWVPTVPATVLPCRLNPLDVNERQAAGQTRARGQYMVVFAAGAPIGETMRLEIQGSTRGVAWTRTVAVEEIRAPRSTEVLRKVVVREVEGRAG